MYKSLIILCIGLMSVSVATATTPSAGKTQRLIAGLLPKAEQGSVQAQRMLANIYLQGLGVKQDYKKAAFWMEKAASHGDVEAQFNIAMMLSKGEGAAKDEKAAFQWFLKAAEQKDLAAQYKVALAYRDGVGTLKEPVAAKKWLEQVLASKEQSDADQRTQLIRQQIMTLAKQDLAALNQ